ncbi:MAG: signal recognition particle-docking protein FtsY [Candidatus Rokubacteria bacterium]|nr:signal recognition particle-docking protein FtsY [Candidatus Rokubacteria bacterium]MBI2878557.1 signal recognition particle-docking protein FtsY [Candidatus Rokubacteria bacterium]
MSLFAALTDRLREGLGRTRQTLQEGFDRLFRGRELEPSELQLLEELLISADLGVETAEAFVAELREEAGRGRLGDRDVRIALRDHLLRALKGAGAPLNLEARPAVVLVLGVNGSGKTTSAGKLAHRLRQANRRVLLAAADTFRAAAIEQLERWGERVGVEVIKQGPGADPSAVAFDAVKAALARRADALIVDTAGRLHTKVNLMAELAKVKRVVGRQLPGAPHETLMVLDATTGQNGIAQARLFHQALELTGLILTKLDGTAKGGIVVRIYRELGLPIKLVATGEGVDDLAPFDPEVFVSALVA